MLVYASICYHLIAEKTLRKFCTELHYDVMMLSISSQLRYNRYF